MSLKIIAIAYFLATLVKLVTKIAIKRNLVSYRPRTSCIRFALNAASFDVFEFHLRQNNNLWSFICNSMYVYVCGMYVV